MSDLSDQLYSNCEHLKMSDKRHTCYRCQAADEIRCLEARVKELECALRHQDKAFDGYERALKRLIQGVRAP